MFRKIYYISVISLSVFVPLSSLAFAPAGYLNDDDTHEGIIQDIYDAVGRGRDFTFDKRGSYDIGMPESAVSLENFVGDSDAFQDAERHCDSEKIVECHNFIVNETFTALDWMNDGYWDTGYIHLGYALHALQDFYAHSNWVKLHEDGHASAPILENFGKYHTITYTPKHADIQTLLDNTITIYTWHWWGPSRTWIPAPLINETTYNNLLPQEIKNLYNNDNGSPLETKAKKFKESMQNVIFDNISLATATSDTNTCLPNEDPGLGNYKYIPELIYLTSGYVGTPLHDGDEPDYEDGTLINNNKCNHGGGAESIISDYLLGALTYGINKDEPAFSNHTPKHEYFSVAYDAATKATISHLNYVAQLLNINENAGNSSHFKSNDKTDKSLLRSMFPAGSSIAFGISGDNEGRMIKNMQQALTPVVTTKRSVSKEVPVKQYLLSVKSQNTTNHRTKNAGDKNENISLAAKNRNQLLDRLDSFSERYKQKETVKSFHKKKNQAKTCSVLSIQQLRDLVIKTNSSGHVYFYTDATSTNQQQALSDITTLALQKNITLNYLTTDCGSNDKGFQQSAGLTGGEVISVASRLKNKTSIGDKIRNIIQPVLAGGMRTLLIASDNVKNGTQIVPVDSSMSTMYLSIGHDQKTQINLIAPNGQKVAINGHKNIKTTSLSNGSLITIQEPEVGQWKIELSGTADSRYTLNVKTQSAIGFPDFRLFQPKLNYMGEMVTFRSLSRNPVSKAYQSKAFIVGDLRQVHFELRAMNGKLLQKLELNSGAKNSHLFSGEIKIPAKEFRVYMTALNTKDEAVTRVFPRVFKGQSVELSLQNMNKNILKSGDEFSAKIKATNYSKESEFHITVADQFGLSNNEFDITLDTDIPEVFDIQFNIPEYISSGTEIILTMTISSVDGDKTKVNSQVQSLYISR